MLCIIYICTAITTRVDRKVVLTPSYLSCCKWHLENWHGYTITINILCSCFRECILRYIYLVIYCDTNEKENNKTKQTKTHKQATTDMQINKQTNKQTNEIANILGPSTWSCSDKCHGQCKYSSSTTFRKPPNKLMPPYQSHLHTSPAISEIR